MYKLEKGYRPNIEKLKKSHPSPSKFNFSLPRFSLGGLTRSLLASQSPSSEKMYEERKMVTDQVLSSNVVEPSPPSPIESLLMRLTKVKILNWNSRWSKKATIYVITTVTDGKSATPINLDLKSFQNIQKGDALSIGSPGVAMYMKTGELPPFLDSRILIARSKQGDRDVGSMLEEISKNNDYKSALTALGGLIGGPVAPIFSQVSLITEIIGKILQLEKDDQLIYYPITVTREFDNYALGTHCDTNRYVEFCFETSMKAD